MKAEASKVMIESRLVLDARELSILNHICSYAFDNKKFAKARKSSSCNGGVTEKEIQDFITAMRVITDSMMKRIEEDSAEIFSHNGGKQG